MTEPSDTDTAYPESEPQPAGAQASQPANTEDSELDLVGLYDDELLSGETLQEEEEEE